MISSFSLLLELLVWFYPYQDCDDYSRDFDVTFLVDGRVIKAYIITTI